MNIEYSYLTSSYNLYTATEVGLDLTGHFSINHLTDNPLFVNFGFDPNKSTYKYANY